MYGDRYPYGPGFGRRGRGRFPGGRGYWGGGPGMGWCRHWVTWDAPHYGAPPWAAPHEVFKAGAEMDEGEWLKAEAAELRAEAEAIKNELSEIEKRLAEIEGPEKA
jgi:methyl coenzyme M reductase beta subunit